MARSLLLWLERTLLVIGVALGAWCLDVLVEARFAQRLRAPTMATLPGESGDSRAEIPHQIIKVAPAAGAWLAQLSAPSLELSTVVLEGTDDRTLRRAAGHIEDTALPGEPGNVGIAGHRDTIFRPLRRAKAGDAIDLSTADHVYHYRISRTLIVDPDDVYVLDPTGQPTLTLVTCYPFEFIGHAPRRFIIQAELTGEEGTAPVATASSRPR